MAGISLETERWVRPISTRPNGEIPFQDGVFDLIRPALLETVSFEYEEGPHDPAQPENVLLKDGTYESTGSIEAGAAYDFLKPYLASGPGVLGDCEPDISEDIAVEGLESSLCLVEPDEITFLCEPPFKPGKERKARAIFGLGSCGYDMGVTDGIVAPRVREQSYGSYSTSDLGLGEPARTFLTVSMTTPFRGSHWKLVAAVFLLPED